MNVAEFREVPIKLPPMSEQEAFATARQRVDDAVAGHVARRRQVESVKSALMSVLRAGEVRVKPDAEVT